MYYALVHYLGSYPKEIDAFRKLHDSRVNVTPPHLTLIFPVDSSIGEKKIINHISDTIRTTKSIDVIFDGIVKSWDDYIFLTLQEGRREITKLHDQLYTGILATYLHPNIEYIPHVTLGVVSENRETDLIQEAESLNIHFASKIDKLSLIRCQSNSTPHEWEKVFDLT